VHLTRQLNERCGDLIQVLLSAEPAEPEAAAIVADGMRRHEHGAGQFAQRLAALGALRAGTTPERASAVFSMMTSPASWRQLTHRDPLFGAAARSPAWPPVPRPDGCSAPLSCGALAADGSE
jgi:hypothetical protein